MAGGPITVTDRISVRVTAKNQEQSNSQKRDVGGSIAKTLGNGNVSDSLKDQLGNTKNPVITDENGDTWVSEEDVIDAGKAMNDAGAFATDKSYRYGNIACINKYDLPLYEINGVGKKWGWVIKWSTGSHPYVYLNETIYDDDTCYLGVIKSNETNDAFMIFDGTWSRSTSANNTKDPSFDPNLNHHNEFDTPTNSLNYIALQQETYELDPLIPVTIVGNVLLSLSAYGDFHEEPAGNGSPINWTKPDNEIDPQIHELFETMRTMDGKDYVKVAIATESSGESGSGDSGSGGGHTGGDF